MRNRLILLAAILATIVSRRDDAQAARVGRLPLFDPPPAGSGICRSDPVSAALQRDGIVRLISFQSSDSTAHRLVSLGMNARGAPVMLMTMMGTEHGRRGETESVNVFFGGDGVVARGRRRAFTTGTPTRLSDDRQLGLLPADSLAAQHLVAALRQRCRA